MTGSSGQEPPPRGIAVFDVGASRTKLTLFDSELRVLAQHAVASVHRPGPPYRYLDPEPALAFLAEALIAADRVCPVDVVVPCAHGSALALLAGDGSLALPVMDYQAEPPVEVVEGYAAIAPPFAEVFAPVNPAGLTAGRQLYWQETAFPQAFERVRTIIPWGQYFAFRLSGEAVCEVSALGAQTQLWDVRAGTPSSLALARGWARRLAPLRPAWRTLGPVRAGVLERRLRGAGRVLTGVHDSNANLLRYPGAVDGPFTLLSTGTWIIGFSSAAALDGLDPGRDTVANVSVRGDPIAASRFMGGREFEVLADGAPPDAASLRCVRRLIEAKVFALPSFTDAGGPMPGTGGRGTVLGPVPESAAGRASLAALYTALMTAESLDAMGADDPLVIVDGPFAANTVFLAVLARLIQPSELFASRASNGTEAGAALLALADEAGGIDTPGLELMPVRPAALDGLGTYRARWAALSQKSPPS